MSEEPRREEETVPVMPEETAVPEETARTPEELTQTPEAVPETPEPVQEEPQKPPETPNIPPAPEVWDGHERRHGERRKKNGKPVAIYVLLLFTIALLLMAFSSLIHQRSNTETLGRLQSDLSAMREVQDFQEQIIALQKSRQELEEQVKEVQRDMAALLVQAQEEHNHAEALRRLYLLMMEYDYGRYQSCQLIIDAFDREGLESSLPAETDNSGVVSPLDRYRQLKDATSARIAEALPPQPLTVEEGAMPETVEPPGEEEPIPEGETDWTGEEVPEQNGEEPESAPEQPEE